MTNRYAVDHELRVDDADVVRGTESNGRDSAHRGSRRRRGNRHGRRHRVDRRTPVERDRVEDGALVSDGVDLQTATIRGTAEVVEAGRGIGGPGRGAARVERGSPASGHDVSDAGWIRGAGPERPGPLVIVLVPADRQLHPELLEYRIERGTDIDCGAVFAPCAVRRPMEQRDLPGLPGCAEVRLQPRQLGRATR